LSLIQKNKQLLDTKGELERRSRIFALLFRARTRDGASDARSRSWRSLCSSFLQGHRGARCRAARRRRRKSGDLVEYVYDATAPGALTRIGVKAARVCCRCHVARRNAAGASGARSPYWHERVEGSLPFPVDAALALPLEGESAPLGAVALVRYPAGFACLHGRRRELDAAGRRQRFDGRAAVLSPARLVSAVSGSPRIGRCCHKSFTTSSADGR